MQVIFLKYFERFLVFIVDFLVLAIIHILK